MLAKIEGKRRRGRQRIRWLDSITDYIDMNLRKLWEMAKDRGAWYATVHMVTKSQSRLSDRAQHHPRLDRKRLSYPNRLLNVCTRSDKVYLTRLKCGFCFSRQLTGETHTVVSPCLACGFIPVALAIGCSESAHPHTV